MANKSTSSPSNTPWREGRPSFKGYRVEFFLLILFTLVCIVCAFVWSASVVKNERKESQSSSTSFYAPSSFAFAQDASIDELDKSAANKASDQTEEKADSANVAGIKAAVAEKSNAALDKITGDNWKIEVLLIWGVCLIVPLILWIWRGWVWFSTLYGIKYELRCDSDNPKATTFLITRGIFHKRTDSMHIGQIADIHSEQSLLQKYLLGGIGNVILHTKDLTDPTVNMKNMDEPNRVFNAFDELRRHYWGRGGFQLNQDGGDVLGEDANL